MSPDRLFGIPGARRLKPANPREKRTECNAIQGDEAHEEAREAPPDEFSEALRLAHRGTPVRPPTTSEPGAAAVSGPGRPSARRRICGGGASVPMPSWWRFGTPGPDCSRTPRGCPDARSERDPRRGGSESGGTPPAADASPGSAGRRLLPSGWRRRPTGMGFRQRHRPAKWLPGTGKHRANPRT
jgi:hypothetical protein